MKSKVQAALEELRPYIQADGGDVELVRVKDGVVTVRLTGHCVGCPSSTVTLKSGIEQHLKQRIPEVNEVRHEESESAAAPAPIGTQGPQSYPDQSPFQTASQMVSKSSERGFTATDRSPLPICSAIFEASCRYSCMSP